MRRGFWIMGMVVALAQPVWAQKQVGATANAEASTPAVAKEARPLFFRELMAFSTDAHRQLTLPAQRSDYSFAAPAHLLPLTLVEVVPAVHTYPILFVQEGERIGLAALMGLPGSGNRFIDAKGRWREGAYIPAYVRSYPFIAVRPGPKEQPLIAFDPTASDFKTKGGEALVGKDGQPTERLQSIVKFLTEYQALAERTRTAAQALKDAGVLEPGNVNLNLPDGQSKHFDGFLMVNEGKLRELKPEALKKLVDADALGLAYAHLISLSNLEALQTGAATARKP